MAADKCDSDGNQLLSADAFQGDIKDLKDMGLNFDIIYAGPLADDNQQQLIDTLTSDDYGFDMDDATALAAPSFDHDYAMLKHIKPAQGAQQQLSTDAQQYNTQRQQDPKTKRKRGRNAHDAEQQEPEQQPKPKRKRTRNAAGPEQQQQPEQQDHLALPLQPGAAVAEQEPEQQQQDHLALPPQPDHSNQWRRSADGHAAEDRARPAAHAGRHPEGQPGHDRRAGAQDDRRAGAQDHSHGRRQPEGR